MGNLCDRFWKTKSDSIESENEDSRTPSIDTSELVEEDVIVKPLKKPVWQGSGVNAGSSKNSTSSNHTPDKKKVDDGVLIKQPHCSHTNFQTKYLGKSGKKSLTSDKYNDLEQLVDTLGNSSTIDYGLKFNETMADSRAISNPSQQRSYSEVLRDKNKPYDFPPLQDNTPSTIKNSRPHYTEIKGAKSKSPQKENSFKPLAASSRRDFKEYEKVKKIFEAHSNIAFGLSDETEIPKTYISSGYSEVESLPTTRNSQTERELSLTPNSNLILEDSLLLHLQPSVPVVKEIVTLSQEEEHFSDEQNAVVYGLRNVLLISNFIKHIANCKNQCTISHILNCYTQGPGYLKVLLGACDSRNLLEKLRVFLKTFPEIFKLNASSIQITAQAATQVKLMEFHFIVEFLKLCIEVGKVFFEDIAEYMKKVFEVKEFPHFGKITVQALQEFALPKSNIFGFIGKNQLFLKNEQSSCRPANQTKLEVVKYFEKYFSGTNETCKIKIEDLSRVLSYNKPQLLASLEERSYVNIFQILEASGKFVCDDGNLYPKQNISASKTENRNNLPKAANAVKGSANTSARKIKLTSDSAKTTTNNQSIEQAVCCVIGTVIKVDAKVATVFCLPGKFNCSCLVHIKSNFTTFQNKLIQNVSEILLCGCYIAFKAESKNNCGFIDWTIIDFTIIANSKGRNFCVCGQVLNTNCIFQKTQISNGVAHNSSNSFFWNSKGIVKCEYTGRATIWCYLNNDQSKDDQQYMNVRVPSTTMIIDQSGPTTSIEANERVECDIMLREQNGMLNWIAVCIRKKPISEMLMPTRILWNCEGVITNIDQSSGIILSHQTVMHSTVPLYVKFVKGHVWFQNNEFEVEPFNRVLQVNEKIYFDAEHLPQPDGIQWRARLIRRSSRPELLPLSRVKLQLDNLQSLLAQRGQSCGDIEKEFYNSEARDIEKYLHQPQQAKVSKLANFLTGNPNEFGSQTVSTGPVVSFATFRS